MKRFSLLLAVLLVAASCGTMSRERHTVVYYYDYSLFPDMWISPNPCTLPHKALGDIMIEVYPGVEFTNKKGPDGIYTKDHGSFKKETIDGSELLGMAVAEAKARGADGISNLRITVDKSETGAILLYRISGLLICME